MLVVKLSVKHFVKMMCN